MKKRRPSTRLDVLLIVVGLIVAILALPGYLIYNNIQQLLINQLGHDATSTAITVARFLERDVDAYRAFHDTTVYEDGAYDAAWYNETRGVLGKIKVETGADFIFTEKWVDDNTIAYLLDAEEPGSENYSSPGAEDSMSDPERKAFLEGISTDSGMIRDPEWGDYLTGFSPIHDQVSGRVLGLVGVDYSLSSVQHIISNVMHVIVGGLLIIALLGSLVILRLIDMRYVAMEIDYLTGLYSKHYFDRQLTRLQRSAEQTGVTYCHSIMDIDDFKVVNDTYSHQDGDDVLKAVAEILQSNVRASDCCARLGGDEFGLLFPDTKKEEAELILERIRAKVAKTTLHVGNGAELGVTLSIGFVVWESGMGVTDMESHADDAMYSSKNSGKNRITLFQHTASSADSAKA